MNNLQREQDLKVVLDLYQLLLLKMEKDIVISIKKLMQSENYVHLKRNLTDKVKQVNQIIISPQKCQNIYSLVNVEWEKPTDVKKIFTINHFLVYSFFELLLFFFEQFS